MQPVIILRLGIELTMHPLGTTFIVDHAGGGILLGNIPTDQNNMPGSK